MKKRFLLVSSVLLITLMLWPPFTAASKGTPNIIVPSGHSGLIASIAVSPDSRFLVSGGVDRRIILWELATGRQLKSFTLPGNITAVDFNSDGTRILAYGGGTLLAQWNIRSGRQLTNVDSVRGMSLFSGAAYIPDSSSMITTGYGELQVWDQNSGNEIRTIGSDLKLLQAFAVSPSGQYVLTGGEKKQVHVFDVTSGREVTVFKKHGDSIVAIAVSSDNTTVASATFSNIIKLWDLTTGKQIDKIKTKEKGIYALAFSAKGDILISGHADGSIEGWSVKTGKMLNSFKAHEKAVMNLQTIPGNSLFASAGADGQIKLWDIETGELQKTLSGKASVITAAVFDRTGEEIMIGLSDNSVRIVTLDNVQQKTIISRTPTEPYSLSFSDSMKHVLIQNHQREAFLWDVDKNRDLFSFKNLSLYSFLSDIAPNGESFILSYRDKRLERINTGTGKTEKEFESKDSLLLSATYSNNGKIIALGTEDGHILILDSVTLALMKTFKVEDVSVSHLLFSADDRFLLSGARKGIVRLHNLETGTLVYELEGHTDLITALAFSADERYALSGSYDATSKLWDIKKGTLLQTFHGHSSYVQALSLLHSGKILVSIGRDSVIKYWNTDSGEELASVVLINQSDWVVVTPDGFFDGTDDGIQKLHYEMDLKTLPLDSFFETCYSPRLLTGILTDKKSPLLEKTVSIQKGVAFPPVVTILKPQSSQIFQSPEIALSVKVDIRDSGLDELRIYHNGRLLQTEQRGLTLSASEQSKSLDYSIRGIAGPNEIRVTALNKERVESDPAVVRFTVQAPGKEANLHLLAIGINNYKNSTYNLNYGKPDAEAIARTLEAQSSLIFKNLHKIIITDAQATRPTIEQSFQTIARTAKEEDVFVFFYAGHGVMSEADEEKAAEYFLALHDVTQLYGKNELLWEKGVSSSDLKNFCLSIPARKQVLIIDACQAGGAVESFTFRGAAEQRAMAQLARSTGMVIIASSGTEQFASEFAQLGHGVFTYALLQGLRGDADSSRNPDGKITIKELEAYLNDTVPELTEKYHGTPQYPNSYARGNDFPLVVKE